MSPVLSPPHRVEVGHFAPRHRFKDRRLVSLKFRHDEQGERLPHNFICCVAEDAKGASFHVVTTLSSVKPMMASSDESTIVARRAFCCSAFLRSVMSRIVLDTRTPSSVSRGLKLISIGNSVPFFRRPCSSSPEPIARTL